MIHKRIITLEGPKEWIKKTLKNSLQEGLNDSFLEKGKSITVETIEGEPVINKKPLVNKPEKIFEQD